MIKKISKINPKITIENIAQFLSTHLASQNEFTNNLEVHEMSATNVINVKSNLKSHNVDLNSLVINDFRNRNMNITDNEIIFDPNTIISLRGSQIKFNINDLIESIVLLKYIVQICGPRLDKCDIEDSLNSNKRKENFVLLVQKLFNDLKKKKIGDKEKESKPIKPKQLEKKQMIEENRFKQVNDINSDLNDYIIDLDDPYINNILNNYYYMN